MKIEELIDALNDYADFENGYPEGQRLVFIQAADALESLTVKCNGYKYKLAAAQAENSKLAEKVSELSGYWIPFGENEAGKVLSECSQCNLVVPFHSNYCPQCGARMDEEESHE